MSRNINKAETVSALIVVALGIGVMALGSGYPVGTIDRMGPGYFPLLLGGLLALIGVGLVFEVLRSEPIKLRFPVRPFAAVTAGMLAFAFLAERAGLVPAIFALVILGVCAEEPIRIKNALAISVFMSMVGVLVFIMGLGIPLSAFWW